MMTDDPVAVTFTFQSTSLDGTVIIQRIIDFWLRWTSVTFPVGVLPVKSSVTIKC